MWLKVGRLLAFRVSTMSDYQALKHKLVMFPYSHINDNIHSLRVPTESDDFLAQHIFRDAIAWVSIKQFKDKQLKLYYEELFAHSPPQQLTGAHIYSRYFLGQHARIQKALTGSNNEQEILYYLKAIFYLVHKTETPIDLQSYGLDKVRKEGSLVVKAYVLGIYSKSSKLIPLVEQFSEEFAQANARLKMRASLVILSIPEFNRTLPKKLVAGCMYSICPYVHEMEDWELHQIASFIFGTNMLATRKLVEAISEHLTQCLGQEANTVKVPLLMKVNKLRLKLSMEGGALEAYVKDNPQKFHTIFFRKHSNKNYILEALASKDSKRMLPLELQLQFSGYASQVVEDASKADEFDSDELINVLKAIVKFHNNIEVERKAVLKEKIKTKILPMYIENVDVAFWSLLFLIQLDKRLVANSHDIKTLCFTMLDNFKKELDSSQDPLRQRDLLDKSIEVWYQLVRVDAPRSSHREAYFDEYDLRLVTDKRKLVHICYLILKMKLKPQANVQIARAILPAVEKAIEEDKLNSKDLFTFLDAMKVLNEPDSQQPMHFFYSKVERAIIRLLKSEASPLQPNDLLFVQRHFKNYLPNHRKFINLLVSVTNNPDAIKKHLLTYDQSLGDKPK